MVELAVVLPLLMFFFVVAVDYSRLFYFSQIVTNCARNGAMYASDPVQAAYTPYADVEEAAKADVKGQPAVHDMLIVPPPIYGTDTHGDYCEVTVKYPFSTITKYPGIPTNIVLTRTFRVRVAPEIPE